MSNFKIAVITPVYNGVLTIENSIQSLLNQSFKDWINIIVNDGSTDDTAKILDKYLLDPRFYVIDLKENKGRGNARKVALEVVKKLEVQYMCMLDADDSYYPDKLTWQFAFMEANVNITLASSQLGYLDKNSNLAGVSHNFGGFKTLKFNKSEDYVSVPHASSIIRVSDIGIITFDEDFVFSEDHDFMIRMLLHKSYVYIPKLSYLYNMRDSFSLTKYKISSDFYLKTYRKLLVSTYFLIKLKYKLLLKNFLVSFLVLVGQKQVYLNRVGRPPTLEEKQYHKSVQFDV